MSVLDLKRAAFAFRRDGEYEMLMFHLGQAMSKNKRLSVVEREALEDLLTELKLGTSSLADPKAALALGKVIPAGLIATGTLRAEDGRFAVDLRFAETETTRVSLFISQTQEPGESVPEFAQRLARKIAEKINETYPLKNEESI